jgi:hypothetical protein
VFEMGVGMRRFSCAYVNNFSPVCPVEPSDSYVAVFKMLFAGEHVSIANMPLEDF